MGAAAAGNPEHLLTLARGGSTPVLGQLLELYRGYLTLLARVQLSRRLQSKADASDLVQEVFLQAHDHFPRFRGSTEGELLSWLRQILATTLANLVRHYCGTQRRDVRLERHLAAELDESSRVLERSLLAPQSSPSQQAARREQAVLLADALARLPADYREVIVLRHLEGLTFAEVARRMGRTLDRVKKLWTPWRGCARPWETLMSHRSDGRSAEGPPPREPAGPPAVALDDSRVIRAGSRSRRGLTEA
jgi:RNA polymerase sigma-70 factor (ECF subfamily)